jgi:hypothetical protein
MMMNAVGGMGSPLLANFGRTARPDPAQVAQKMVGKLDGDDKGYLVKEDFEAKAPAGADPARMDELFARLDGDGDGRVTEAELTTRISEKQQMVAARLSQIGQSALGGLTVSPLGGEPRNLASILIEKYGSTAEDAKPQSSFFV